MQKSAPLAKLLGCLLNLPATGENGFEGLLRDAISLLTKQKLTLGKGGGPQCGGDMWTGPQDTGPSIVVEAKRYGPTRIKIDQLKMKLVEAVERRPELDIMAFGATREINSNDGDALITFGASQGVGVVLIDWAKSSVSPPRLAVLCALAPNALLGRVAPASHDDLEDALSQVRQLSGFLDEEQRLIASLVRPDMGWSNARFATACWLRDAFSNTNRAWSELRGRVNLLDSDVRIVPRPRLMAALDNWWSEPTSPIALLGEEGVGKSWAPLAWWHERSGFDGTGLPLTLVVPATDVNDPDISGLIARLLAQRTKRGSIEFWERRIALWLKAPVNSPQLVLVFDGLNQHWNFMEWGRILARLAEDPWKGRAAVIFTCRPDHWKKVAQDISHIQPVVHCHTVNSFDDGELAALLGLYGLSRDDFASALIPLLKVPRLSALAVQHRKILADSGDITPERLIYEDWKDRFRYQGGRIISDVAFREYILRIGKNLRDRLLAGGDFDLAVSRRSIEELLNSYSYHSKDTINATISEIVDGRWMLPVEGRADLFRLNLSLAPNVLAMGLVEHLRENPDDSLNYEFAQFIDPLNEHNITVSILRNAFTIALLDYGCSHKLRRLLLEKWLQRQNLGGEDFDVLWRLIPCDLELFLSFAEDEWLHHHNGFHFDEMLIKGIYNASERWPTLGSRILEWCSLWLGTHWDDPVEGMVINYNASADDVPERRAATRLRRKSWDALVAERDTACDALLAPIRDRVEGSVSWLACRVLGILSYMPCRDVIPALTAWAISRAVMGEFAGDVPQSDQVNWILRLARNDEDGSVAEAVVRIAESLVQLANPIAEDAARLLLTALATPESARKSEGLKYDTPSRYQWPKIVTVQSDGILHWDRTCYQRREKPLSRAAGLAWSAINPAYRLSAADQVALASFADESNADGLWLQMGQTGDDVAFGDAECALSRWAPSSLGSLVRRIFGGARSRDHAGLRKLGYKAPSYSLLLDEVACTSVNEAASLVSCGDADDVEDIRELRFLSLIGKSASEQIAFFCTFPDGPDFESSLAPVLAVPGVEDFSLIASHLEPDAPIKQLRGWLWYLVHAPLDFLTEDFPPLRSLFFHEDVIIRELSLKIARKCGGPIAMMVLRSGWRYTERMSQEEKINGSLALLDAGKKSSLEDIIDKIAPHSIGFLIEDDSIGDISLDVFSRLIENYIHEDIFGDIKSKSYPSKIFILEKPIWNLVRFRSDDVVRWIRPLLDGVGRSRFSMFVEHFPYVWICQALLDLRPDDGVTLWRRMHKTYEYSFFRRPDFTLLPFQVRNSDQINKLRDDICDFAKSDEELGRIACAVIEHGHTAWIIGRIRRYLAGPSSASIARGIWLAGLLDLSVEADTLWATELAQTPGSGWLENVYKQARHQYMRNCWARHWLSQFLAERDQDRAFGCYRLFLECADSRSIIWASELVRSALHDLPKKWLVHWNLAVPSFKRAVEQNTKNWKEHFCGTKITHHLQWPWK